MRKNLLSLLFAAGMAMNGISGEPLDLNLKLTGDESKTRKVYDEWGVMNYGSNNIVNGNYSADVIATRFDASADTTPTRGLTFKFQDKDTQMYITDEGVNGLSEGDWLTLNHKFKSGEEIAVRVLYEKNGDFSVSSDLYSTNSSPSRFYINTSEVTGMAKGIVRKKINPVIQWGERLYYGLVDSTLNDKEINVPYEGLKTALAEVEKNLLALREGNTKSEKVLLKLTNQYSKMAKEQIRKDRK